MSSLFRETIRKVPWYLWVLLPLGLLAAIFFAFRGRGTPRVSGPLVDHTAPPAISPEVAEEKREAVKEDAKTDREAIKEEAGKARNDVDNWLKP